MIDAFGFLDKVIFGRLMPTPSPEQIAEMVAAAKEKSADKTYHMLDEATGDIDSKTAALLTHISLIIAALTFLYATQSGVAFKFMIMIEVSVYLCLAILCLRAIRYTVTYSKSVLDNHGANISFSLELAKRGQIYNFVASATIYVTMSMIVLLIGDGLFAVCMSATK
jgi:hypothetical protein